MAEYTVTLVTSDLPKSGTFSTALLTLIGTEGTSEEFKLDTPHQNLCPGSARRREGREETTSDKTRPTCHLGRPEGASTDRDGLHAHLEGHKERRLWRGVLLLPSHLCARLLMSVVSPLGRLVLVRLHTESRPGFPELAWHCREVRVELPGGPAQHFPCMKWISSVDSVELWEGEGTWTKTSTFTHKSRRQDMCEAAGWRTINEGLPRCVDMTSLEQLGPDFRYTRSGPGFSSHYLRGFAERCESWKSFEEIETLFIFNCPPSRAAHAQVAWTHVSRTLQKILRLSTDPQQRVSCVCVSVSLSLFPVTSSVVSVSRLQRGTIFLADYEILEGVPANLVNGQQQHLAAPLCLLYRNQQGELLPIAIQLKQNPGPDNPVFLPSDSEADWLLAKIWVRNSDFQCHQLGSHYLKTHMLGEAYCVATLRHLPGPHPLHKLLMPHLQTTLQINIQARASLLAKGGVFDKSISCGLDGAVALIHRAMQRLRYSALCLPEDLRERGVDSLDNNYFGRDGLRVWGAIHRFVEGLLQFFYPSDSAVQQDSELQSWITDIFQHAFLGLQQTGFPQSFQNRAELVKFVTMVIFSCTALHAAVNFSQLDFNLWMPNCPASLRQPPPSSKGSLTLQDLLHRLPEVNSTCSVLLTLAMLSQPSSDYIPLGCYRDPPFTEETPRNLVSEFQAALRTLGAEIDDRNAGLELPYRYLRPDLIENSVSI
ncbi:polyunsaturated fatty acid lipoxygenase ALOX15B [Polyodon spathula]|uniref:polyunsaturated fatty acid lipoxygenase ALOX15B n=1 Tax=Polyodon spathula TaxID=7913 RepID=UPI001B7F39A8|nr:polyunsaturated fatty acid lipoxygenase ALOX15B [Polyodon spathula]